jgi:hypothetical protein
MAALNLSKIADIEVPEGAKTKYAKNLVRPEYYGRVVVNLEESE